MSNSLFSLFDPRTRFGLRLVEYLGQEGIDTRGGEIAFAAQFAVESAMIGIGHRHGFGAHSRSDKALGKRP